MLVSGMVVAGRTPKTSSHARFWGWEDGSGGGGGQGGQNPENEQSCSLLGLGDGGGSQNPETSIRAHFGDGGGSSRQAEGWQGGGGSKNPEISTNARFGDGGGRQRAAESRKRAVVLVFGVGRMVVVAVAGRGQVEPRK